ncbi:MAG TPA: MarR family transcriptional regulator [Candidatus Cybelea sp.]|jgi:DNA-binding MarR family transcriptional regulator
MASKDLPQLPCACANLRRAARAVSQIYEEELRGSGLRATQLSLLQAVQIAGTLSQGDLGSLLCIDSTTLSRTLRPLVKNGWIAGRRGTDKRERLFSLTGAGKRKLEQITPHWKRAQRRFMRSVRGDAAQLEEQLRGLASALS